MNDRNNGTGGDRGRLADPRRAGGEAPGWAIPPALTELWEAGQTDTVLELVHLFLTDTTERLAGLENACKDGDLEQVRRLAHTIKGSCSQMGEASMAALSKDLEEQAKGGSLGGSVGTLAAITRQFEATRQAIRAFLEQHT